MEPEAIGREPDRALARTDPAEDSETRSETVSETEVRSLDRPIV